jgi:tRNA-specific 2-thiouridylase
VLGRHDGVHAFTVGQRRGLGLAAEAPLYVRRIDAARRRLVVATADRLEARRVIASPWSWIRRPIEGELLSSQVRHRGPAARVARLQIDDGGVDVSLAEPVRALAPGQAAVLYGGAQGEEVLGGGTILAEPAARSGG